MGGGLLVICQWLCFVAHLADTLYWKAKKGAVVCIKRAFVRHTQHPLDFYPVFVSLSLFFLFYLSLSVMLPIWFCLCFSSLKYDRTVGHVWRRSSRCQLSLMVIPWKWTLLRVRRELGKIPIIFTASKAFRPEIQPSFCKSRLHRISFRF